MAFREGYGNPPIYSTTAASGTDPSTSALIAQLENLTDDIYEVRFGVGASTAAVWRFEHALSTGLGSTAIRKQIVTFTGTNQTAEYIYTFKAETGDRFRIVPLSSFTGTYGGVIQAEKLT